MTEKQRARARQLHQQGRTVRAISAALGVPKATVGRAVKAAAQ
jgi:IS30 family transposase